jgi:hypothetical protein
MHALSQHIALLIKWILLRLLQGSSSYLDSLGELVEPRVISA